MHIKNLFNNIGHGVAWFVKNTIKVARGSADVASKVVGQAGTVEDITKAVLGPDLGNKAAELEDLMAHLFGSYAQAALALGDAAASNGVNVPLDKNVHDRIMAFAADVKTAVDSGLKK